MIVVIIRPNLDFPMSWHSAAANQLSVYLWLTCDFSISTCIHLLQTEQHINYLKCLSLAELLSCQNFMFFCFSM